MKYSSSVNYYYKQVFILLKKHLTVDFGWDCYEGISRCVLIFVNFLYQNEHTSSQWNVYGTKLGSCLGHKDVLIGPCM